MVAVGLVFAPLAPLVSLAAGICFWIDSFVYKYQFMFVYVSKVESGGVSTIANLRERHV
jgi:calcium permeable stress-gated cation channel